jgi:hypothetical protein
VRRWTETVRSEALQELSQKTMSAYDRFSDAIYGIEMTATLCEGRKNATFEGELIEERLSKKHPNKMFSVMLTP